MPVWYAYEPGGTVNVVTGGQSVKAERLRAAGRFSLCVQTESMPYRYVSVEGRSPPWTRRCPPTSDAPWRTATRRRGRRPLVASTADQAADSVAFRMTPERWRTTDYGKLG